MLEKVKILVVLFVLLFSVLLVFQARVIVKKKLDKTNENTKVIVIKVVGYILIVLCLVLLKFWIGF